MTKLAVEEEIELQFCTVSIPPLPPHHLAEVTKARPNLELLLLPAEVVSFERAGLVLDFSPHQPDR